MTRNFLLMFFILLVVSINSTYDPHFDSLPGQSWFRNLSTSPPPPKRPTARSSGQVAASRPPAAQARRRGSHSSVLGRQWSFQTASHAELLPEKRHDRAAVGGLFLVRLISHGCSQK